MTRREILKQADICVNGDRDESYGSPEDSFRAIAALWGDYLFAKGMLTKVLEAKDVAAMMALFKVARVATGNYKSDNWVDLAGYAACGGEIEAAAEANAKGFRDDIHKEEKVMAKFEEKKSNEKGFSISAPWYTFRKKLNALFELDPEIIVQELEELDGDEDAFDYQLDIDVLNHEKYMALKRLLPEVKEFGNVAVRITLYDEMNGFVPDGAELFKTLFKGNPIAKDLKTLKDMSGTSHLYLRFVPEVIQFFNDDISDYNGNWNGLAEDIAREVFNTAGMEINFCTAPIEEN